MKLIKTFEAKLNEEDICCVLDVYEFALRHEYKLSKEDVDIVKELMKVDYIRESSNCYPLLFDKYWKK